MIPRNEVGPVVAHLAAIWCVGCVLTAVQFQAALIALFAGGAPTTAAVLFIAVSLSVALFAGVGATARPVVPLTRRARGLWGWAAGVYALGTAGILGAVAVLQQADGLKSSVLLYPSGGVCYAVAAAFFLPGARARLAALGAAAVFAAGATYAAWEAAQPPTVDEWLTANGVDRALLRVGDPPSGYTLRALGASGDGFGADYERTGSAALHLDVARIGHDTRRADARGCPVPFGETIHCRDDGEGRQLVAYEGDYERQELRLRRNGLVHTVTMKGSRAELTAARHILSTLGPATEADLKGLLTAPMRR
ncbi:hypothetical protein [Streptomyces inhibens]|uniref:hypothetical protein n=1 Tax=Streptomyces inhibens TaxID=2293571 RepID=UPI001EE699D9|nr:hypothetical protein [Streptomyces inhibens]UKY47589.1 hypothetical protein KI385_01190 [Streptomyces inhibens]